MHRCYVPGHDFGVSINTYMTDSLYRVVSSRGSKFISKKSRFGTTRGARVGSVSRREVTPSRFNFFHRIRFGFISSCPPSVLEGEDGDDQWRASHAEFS